MTLRLNPSLSLPGSPSAPFTLLFSDTSRMAFETVFHENSLGEDDPLALPHDSALRGGVQIMAYDQRFANSEVRLWDHS